MHNQLFEAALGTARKIGLDRLLGPDGNRCRDLVLKQLVGLGFADPRCQTSRRVLKNSRSVRASELTHAWITSRAAYNTYIYKNASFEI